MAKIVRKNQKIFGSTAGLNQIAKFGSLADGSPERYDGATVDADDVQALSQFLSGWLSAVDAGNSPAIEDVNALHWLATRQLAYVFQAGVPEWDVDTEYHVGSIANDGNGQLYRSLTDNNTGNPLTSTANWTPQVSTPNREVLQNLAVRKWDVETSANDYLWTDVVWSPTLELFAAVAASGVGNRVMTSPDGITWTAQTSAADQAWLNVVWAESLGKFVANASVSPGPVMSSVNGTTWVSEATMPAGVTWEDIYWSEDIGRLVAVGGSGGSIATTDDLITWTPRTSPGFNWLAVTYSPELTLFVAMGTAGNAATSPDGITWTAQTTAGATAVDAVAWSPELNLFCGVGVDFIVTSPDGITWTEQTSPAANSWRDIEWSPELGIFAAIANSGTNNRVMTSKDGVNWDLRYTSVDNTWDCISWSPKLSLFVGASQNGTGDRVLTSR